MRTRHVLPLAEGAASFPGEQRERGGMYPRPQVTSISFLLPLSCSAPRLISSASDEQADGASSRAPLGPLQSHIRWVDVSSGSAEIPYSALAK
jgi:hypothetical protein